LPPPASVQVYALTLWGYQSETRSRNWPLGGAITQARSQPAAQRRLADDVVPDDDRSTACSGTAGAGRLPAGGGGLRRAGRRGGITIHRGDPAGARAIFTSDPSSMASVVYGGRPLEDAEAAGAIAIEGDRVVAADFVTLFRCRPRRVQLDEPVSVRSEPVEVPFFLSTVEEGQGFDAQPER